MGGCVVLCGVGGVVCGMVCVVWCHVMLCREVRCGVVWCGLVW